MPVELHRDPVPRGTVRVVRMPAWCAPVEPGRYWHQPRSAFYAGDGRLVVHLWCGQSRNHVPRRALVDIPPIDQRCGTCIGRRLGYDRAEGSIFRPVDHFRPPRRCPGGDDGTGYCLSCGRRLRYMGRGYSGPFECQHRPDLDGLFERWTPCVFHGWRDMRPIYEYRRPGWQESGRLECQAFDCRSERWAAPGVPL